MKEVIISTHGSAKSNPGAAAIVVLMTDESGKLLSKTIESIGNATDVYAAFTAVARGLDIAAQEFSSKAPDMKFEVTLTNEEVKQQLNGEVPIMNPGIVPHFIEIHNLQVASFPNLTFTYVSEAESVEVCKLVNEVLDGK